MISTRISDPATRHEQLRSAWALLAGGRFQDAGFAFGRILCEEPGHDEARRGREQAEGQLAESRRRADGLAWSRVSLVSFWVLAFCLIAVEVATSWEQIVGRLARAPRQEQRR